MRSDRIALVTGATGFLGSNLVEKLIEIGWSVHAVVRRGSNRHLLLDNVKYHYYDGTFESMQQIVGLANPLVVFHLASLFLSEHKSEQVDSLIQSNITMGSHLLEAMANEGVSNFINTGTSWQSYENEEYNPVNLYAATKQAFEDVAKYYVEALGMRMITLRIYDTYGNDDNRNKLLNLLKQSCGSVESIDMSPGMQKINLVHVDDVVECFIMAADRLMATDTIGSEIYAVKSSTSISLRGLVDLILEITNIEIPINWGSRNYRSREVMAPWDSESLLPGWNARVDLRDGLKKFFGTAQ